MVLKRIKHVDKKPIERSVRESLRVLELRKKFPLIDDRCDRLFIDYFDLGELLHGVKRLELFAFYLPPLVSGVVSVRQIFKDRFGFLIRTNGRVAEAGNKKALHCVGTRWVGCSKHFALIEAATLD